MRHVTRDELLNRIAGYKAVNEITCQEALRLSYEERAAQLEMLHEAGNAMGWKTDQFNDVEVARNNWNQLRKAYLARRKAS